MTTNELAALLDATWFASELAPSTRMHLAAIGRLVVFPEGAVVVREGYPCDSLGIVVDGRIALRLAIPGGGHRTILTVNPGDVFGWSAVLPQPVATSSGVALVPTQAIVFDGPQLRAELDGNDGLAATLYSRLLVSVSRRLVATRVQLLDLYQSAGSPW